MKKIIFLSIGVLFSSVYAQTLSEVEIAHVASELMLNTDFVEKCSELCAQGLTAEQIVRQLVNNDQQYVYHYSNSSDSNSSKQRTFTSVGEVVGVIVGLCLAACGLFGYCNYYCLDGDAPCLMDEMF